MRWSEEQWAQRGAESNVTLGADRTAQARREADSWTRWARRVNFAEQNKPGESTSHSADAPPERDEPPERVAEPPISSSSPELLTGDLATERDSPRDDGMSPNELEQWREAENRFLGIGDGSSSGGSPFSGQS